MRRTVDGLKEITVTLFINPNVRTNVGVWVPVDQTPEMVAEELPMKVEGIMALDRRKISVEAGERGFILRFSPSP